MKLLIGLSSQDSFRPGDKVVVKLKKNEWYAGKVTNATSRKLEILFDDKDTTTVSKDDFKNVKLIYSLKAYTHALSDAEAKKLYADSTALFKANLTSTFVDALGNWIYTRELTEDCGKAFVAHYIEKAEPVFKKAAKEITNVVVEYIDQPMQMATKGREKHRILWINRSPGYSLIRRFDYSVYVSYLEHELGHIIWGRVGTTKEAKAFKAIVNSLAKSKRFITPYSKQHYITIAKSTGAKRIQQELFYNETFAECCNKRNAELHLYPDLEKAFDNLLKKY
jgi:hypothetical protein